ncbi:MAG: DNA primase [archaeon]
MERWSYITDEVKKRVKGIDLASLVSRYGVELTPAGAQMKGLCPFHEEKTASFMIFPDQNTYCCFGCNRHGDTITFVRDIRQVSFPEAVKLLCEEYKIPLQMSAGEQMLKSKKDRLYEMCGKAITYYHDALMSRAGDDARDYLLTRVSERSIQEWRLGFAAPAWDGLHNYLLRDDQSNIRDSLNAGLLSVSSNKVYDFFRNRVMFPIADVQGRVIGFAGRAFGSDDIKYINNRDTSIYRKSGVLFGIDKAVAEIRKSREVVVVEGYLDAIVAHEFGIKNCVALGGTALTEHHIKTLSQMAKKIIFCYDADKGGWESALRSLKNTFSHGILTKIINLKEGDPDEFIKKNGAEEFRRLMRESQDPMSFAIEIKGLASKSTDEKYLEAKKLLDIVHGVRSPMYKALWIQKLGDALGISPNAVFHEYNDDNEKKGPQRSGKGQLKIEDHFIGFLAANPLKRRKALETFVEDDFSIPENLLFFMFLCTNHADDNIIINPKLLINHAPFFGDIPAGELVEEFKRFCDARQIVVHDQQLSRLETVLIDTKKTGVEVMDYMLDVAMNREIRELERRILSQGPGVEDEILDHYNERLEQYRDLRHNIDLETAID